MDPPTRRIERAKKRPRHDIYGVDLEENRWGLDPPEATPLPMVTALAAHNIQPYRLGDKPDYRHDHPVVLIPHTHIRDIQVYADLSDHEIETVAVMGAAAPHRPFPCGCRLGYVGFYMMTGTLVFIVLAGIIIVGAYFDINTRH